MARYYLRNYSFTPNNTKKYVKIVLLKTSSNTQGGHVFEGRACEWGLERR